MKDTFLTAFILTASLAGSSGSLMAQSNTTNWPTVTIFATDPGASETGSDSGTFTVRRTGPTNFALAVFYHLSGTASNGVDYEQLGNSVQIPAGALAADFNVKPIDDSLVESNETVVAQLTGSPLACAACGYNIGSPSNAVVTIVDNDPNTTQAVVNIVATDPSASEIPPWLDIPEDPAVFTVRRSGQTNFALPVYYSVSGTASNGVDYDRLSGTVTIPEGASSATIIVSVIDDTLAEGTETVVITVEPPICVQTFPPPPECYLVGPSNWAVAYIRDNDSTPSNPPPVVTIFAIDAIAVEGRFCWSNWWWTSSGNASGWTINSPAGHTNNCSGTNTATFVVRRSGDTNSDLTVDYAIGGTASNGIDYVTLPGSVTLEAGRRSARIEVIPVDDSTQEGIETVLLTLQSPPASPSNGPPAYVTGFPNRAAALIVDNDQPRPPCMRLPGEMFHLCAPGTNGYSFCLRTSTDMVNWSPLCTNLVTDGAVHYVDADATNFDQRFYQVVPEPGYTPQD